MSVEWPVGGGAAERRARVLSGADAMRRGVLVGVVGLAGLVGLAGGGGAQAQTIFNYTGSAQTYTIPTAATGIEIQANGAGGGGAGADLNGAGGDGGAGAAVSGVYLAAAGSSVTVRVGGGGGAGFMSLLTHTCGTSPGVGGNAAGGLAGGAGGAAGCSGYSGGGGGGGAASVVSTAASVTLIIAGGGSGGQGGSWNAVADPGQGSTQQGALPGNAGGTGNSSGSGDGGGGGGGGGGCPGGAGGIVHPDQSGGADGTSAVAGGSCAAAAISQWTLQGAGGGSGGSGDPAYPGSGSDPGGQAGSAGSVTITPLYPLGGTVYADVDHNATLDAGEGGTGIAGLYVKIAPYSAGVCQSTALAAAAVSSVGTYTLSAVATGTYCLILSNTAALGTTTPYLPPGWINTESAGGVRVVTTAGSPSPSQNFGLYNGSSLSVTVFSDTGNGGGTANDGLQNGAEVGLSGVPVSASVGGTSLASAVSGSNGSLLLWLPASTGGTVNVAPTAAGGLAATGGSVGNTRGSYARPSLNFTYTAGVAYTGVSFGLVPPSSLSPTGAASLQPGTIVFYAHRFVAGSAGQVTFSTAAQSSPTLAGWSQEIYADVLCSGQFTSADPLLSGAQSVSAGQQICLLVKEFAPAAAPPNASNKSTLSASLAYSGAAAPAPVVLTVTDTTVVAGGVTQLAKQVQNLTLAGAYGTSNLALPGNRLQYQLTLVNPGSAALGAVVISDATPAFTTFVAAACPTALPSGLTTCSISVQPQNGGVGAVQWSFAGTLAAGAQVSVTYQVTVSQ